MRQTRLCLLAALLRAGKSALAARIATLYKLPLLSAKALLAATDKLDAEAAKVKLGQAGRITKG
jgi:hypothetical protein